MTSIQTTNKSTLVKALREENNVLRSQLVNKRTMIKDTSLTDMASGKRSLPKYYQKSVRSYKGHVDRIMDMRLSTDNSYMVSSAEDGFVILWNLREKTKSDLIRLSHTYCMSLALNPGGQIVAEGGLNNAVSLYALYLDEYHDQLPQSTKRRQLYEPNMHEYRTILKVAAASGDIDRTPLSLLKGHRAHIGSLEFINDTTVVSGSGDYSIRVWDVISGKCKMELTEHCGAVDTVRLAPGGSNVFLSTASDGLAKLWDTRVASKAVSTISIGSNDTISSRWFPGGGLFAVASEDYQIKLMDFRSNCTIDTYMWDKCAEDNSSGLLRVPNSTNSFGSSTASPLLSAMEFTMDGRCLVCGFADGHIAHLDILKNQWVCSIPRAHSSRVTTLASTNRNVFSAGFDGLIQQWQTV